MPAAGKARVRLPPKRLSCRCESSRVNDLNGLEREQQVINGISSPETSQDAGNRSHVVHRMRNWEC